MNTQTNNLLSSWRINAAEPVGLIFDVDELLIDNNNDIFLAYKSLLDSRGIQMEDGEVFPGKDLFEIISNAKKKYNIADSVESLVEERRANYIEILKTTDAPLMDGVKEIFQFLNANRENRNVRTAYTSSSEKAFVDILFKRIFERCELTDYAERADEFFYHNADKDLASMCWEPGMEKKPSPELYFKTMAKLGVPAGQCIAFEDSKSGMLSALAAGVNLVIAPSKQSRAFFNDFDVSKFGKNNIVVLKSLSEFLPTLTSLVNKS